MKRVYIYLYNNDFTFIIKHKNNINYNLYGELTLALPLCLVEF